MAGYHFRYPCLRGATPSGGGFPSFSWVSFSIPAVGWCFPSCEVGIVFDTQQSRGMARAIKGIASQSK